MKGQRIGYIRVSTADQHTDRQLENIPLDRIFTDKASGKNTQRPELERLLSYAREGDIIIVHSMDRLARIDDLRRLVQSLTARDIQIQFVKENLLFIWIFYLTGNGDVLISPETLHKKLRFSRCLF